MSRPFAEVIGDPIAHSKSPMIHNFWLEKLRIDAEYRACHVRPDGLADYFAQRRNDAQWRGCNITMPHKQAAMPLLDGIDPAAARIGAVNTVLPDAGNRLLGTNTDGPGFLEPLHGSLPGRVAVIGAGGAARAVLAALRDHGVGWVSLQNRSVEKGRALLDEFGLRGEATGIGEAIAPVGLLVNTSSLGMVGNPPLPPLVQFVVEGGIVYDIVTAPLETGLLKAARAHGLHTIDGLAMLIGQAAVAFAKFFGQPAPRDCDAELRALLTS